jgi:hypothetical protein
MQAASSKKAATFSNCGDILKPFLDTAAYRKRLSAAGRVTPFRMVKIPKDIYMDDPPPSS